jgi:hypothetical protein
MAKYWFSGVPFVGSGSTGNLNHWANGVPVDFVTVTSSGTTTQIAFSASGTGALSAAQIRIALLAIAGDGLGGSTFTLARIAPLSTTLSGQSDLAAVQTATLRLASALSGLGEAIWTSTGGTLIRIAAALSKSGEDAVVVLKRVVPFGGALSGTGVLSSNLKSILKLSTTLSGDGVARLKLVGSAVLRRARLSIRQGLGF